MAIYWPLVIIPLALFYLQYPYSFSFSDGGFLWTGSWLTSKGLIPTLDFRSYEPLRYWLEYPFITLLGNSWFAVSIGAFFYFYCALVVVANIYLPIFKQSLNSHYFLFLQFVLIILFVGWAFPVYRLFDHTASLMTIIGLNYFYKRDHLNSYFLTGLLLGILLLLGRNHFLYGVIATVLVFLFTVEFRQISSNKLIAILFGGLAGYSPQMYLFATQQGFLELYFDEYVVNVLRRGTTNLSKDVLFPWSTNIWQTKSIYHLVPKFSLSLIQWNTIISLTICLYVLLKDKINKNTLPPEFVVSTCVAIPYFHHAFTRADITHLAQSIMPVILSLFMLSIMCRGALRFIGSVFVFFSLFAFIGNLVFFRHLVVPQNYREVLIGNESLIMANSQAKQHEVLSNWFYEGLVEKDSFDFLPNMPYMYALNEIKPSLYDTYVFWENDAGTQMREIERFKRTDNLIFSEMTYDSRPELMFSNTQKIFYRYLTSNFCVHKKQENLIWLKRNYDTKECNRAL